MLGKILKTMEWGTPALMGISLVTGGVIVAFRIHDWVLASLLGGPGLLSLACAFLELRRLKKGGINKKGGGN